MASLCGNCEGGVVAEDVSTYLEERFGDHRVHLAGHDRATWLDFRELQFTQPGTRSRAHPAHVVRDLREAQGESTQDSARRDERIDVALRVEVVVRLAQR